MDAFRTISEKIQAVIMNVLAYTTFGAEQTWHMIATLPATTMNSMRSFIHPKTLPAHPPAPAAAAPEMPAYTLPLVFAPDNSPHVQYMTGTTSMSIEAAPIVPTYPVVRQNHPPRFSLPDNIYVRFSFAIVVTVLAYSFLAFLFSKFRRPQVVVYTDEDLKRERDEIRAQLIANVATRDHENNVRNIKMAQCIQQIIQLTQQTQSEAERSQHLETETKRQKDKLSKEIDGLKQSLEQSHQELTSLIFDSDLAQVEAKEKIEKYENEIKLLTEHAEKNRILSTNLRKERDALLNDKSDLESKLKLKQETTNAALRETRSTIRNLQEQVATEQREKKEIVRQMASMAKMAKQWEDEVEATDKLNNDQATQIKELKWQNKEYRDEFSKAKQHQIDDVSKQDLQKALDDTRAQNKNLSTNFTAVKSDLAAVNKKLADAEGIIAKSKTNLADSMAKYNEQSHVNTSLQYENKQKRQQVTRLEKQRDESQEENHKLRRDITNLDREMSKLSEQCNDKSLEVSDLKLQCTKKNLEATELRSECAEKNTAIAELEKTKKPACTAATKSRKEIPIALEILKYAHDEATRSRRKRDGATTKRKPAPKETPRRLRSKTVAYKDLKAKHEDALKEAAQLRDEIAAVKKTVSEQVTSLPTTGSEAEHQQELARLRSEYSAANTASIATAEGEITNLHNLCSSHETDLQDLGQQLNAKIDQEIGRLKKKALATHKLHLRDAYVAARQRRQQTIQRQQRAHAAKIDELMENHHAALQSAAQIPATEDLNAQDEEDLVDAAPTYNFDQTSALVGSTPPGGYFLNAERVGEEDMDADDDESCFMTLEEAPVASVLGSSDTMVVYTHAPEVQGSSDAAVNDDNSMDMYSPAVSDDDDDDALAVMADVMPDVGEDDEEMPDPATPDENGMDHHGDIPSPQPIPSPSPAIPGLGLLGPQPASPPVQRQPETPQRRDTPPIWTLRSPGSQRINGPPPAAVAGIVAPPARASPLRQSWTPEQASGSSVEQVLRSLGLPYYPAPGVTPTPAPAPTPSPRPAPAPRPAPRAVAPSTSTRTHTRAVADSKIDPNLGGLSARQKAAMEEACKALGVEDDEPDAEADPTWDPNVDEGFHETPSAPTPSPAPAALAPAPQTPAQVLPENPYEFVAQNAEKSRSDLGFGHTPTAWVGRSLEDTAEERETATEEVMVARLEKAIAKGQKHVIAPMRKRRTGKTNDAAMDG